MKFNQTKVDLIESLKRTREILGNRSWIPGVIDAIQGIALPDLEGDWEYNIKYKSSNAYQLIKYRQVKDDKGVWVHLDEEVVAELAI